MFYNMINPAANVLIVTDGELALRAFLSEYCEALGNAAVMLADRRGAKLINAIREALDHPGPLTRRVHRLLLELHGLLLFEHDCGDDYDDMSFFAMLDPEDPIVIELCILADGLDEALRGADVISISDERVA